eukprot:gene4639-8212_t
MKIFKYTKYPNLYQIERCIGHSNFKNDVLVSISQEKHAKKNDYEEKMAMNSSEKKYIDYSFENTCMKLQDKFKNQNIFLIVPSKKETVYSFNEYYNFYHPGISLIHLKKLYENSIQFLNQEYKLELDITTGINLIAFSKGCVVLNMICSEISNFYKNNSTYHPWSIPENEKKIPNIYHMKLFQNKNLTNDLENLRKDTLEFSSKFTSMHWLDCHRFINNDLMLIDFIEYLKKSNDKLNLRIHSTCELYGNNDNYYRIHIKPECDYFIEFLKMKWKNNLHFQYFDQEKSMKIHFLIIEKFKDFDE